MIFSPRATGKTTATLNWWRQDPEHRVILTLSQQEADRLIREELTAISQRNPSVPIEQLDPLKRRFAEQIMSAERYFSKRRGRKDSPEVSIDNVEIVLRGLFGNVTRTTASSFDAIQVQTNG